MRKLIEEAKFGDIFCDGRNKYLVVTNNFGTIGAVPIMFMRHKDLNNAFVGENVLSYPGKVEFRDNMDFETNEKRPSIFEILVCPQCESFNQFSINSKGVVVCNANKQDNSFCGWTGTFSQLK